MHHPAGRRKTPPTPPAAAATTTAAAGLAPMVMPQNPAAAGQSWRPRPRAVLASRASPHQTCMCAPLPALPSCSRQVSLSHSHSVQNVTFVAAAPQCKSAVESRAGKGLCSSIALGAIACPQLVRSCSSAEHSAVEQGLQQLSSAAVALVLICDECRFHPNQQVDEQGWPGAQEILSEALNIWLAWATLNPGVVDTPPLAVAAAEEASTVGQGGLVSGLTGRPSPAWRYGISAII